MINLPRIGDPRGDLSFIEGERHVPFPVRRVFYLYGVPAGQTRAGHALRTCEQFVVALAGGFDIATDDGRTRARFRLDRPWVGLHLPPRVWRVLENFAPGSVCLVLASEPYSAEGYFRDYDEFRRAVGGNRAP